MTILDLPVNYASEDKLDRAKFAKTLAKQICDLNNLPSGYVIGIEGAWGTGKTSVINMILQHIEHLQMIEDSQHAIFYDDVDNKPFTLEELERIAPQFGIIKDQFEFYYYNFSYLSYEQFNRCIARRNIAEKLDYEELYRYFRLQVRLREMPKNIIFRFSPWMLPAGAALAATFISELVRATSGHLKPDIQSALKTYSAKVSSLAPVLGAAADAAVIGSGGLFRAAGNWLRGYSEQSDTLDQVKTKLESQLRRMANQKIIVVIDDLDRLDPNEAASMFSLIKGIGQLPNVIYIISYDKLIVSNLIEKALELDYGQGGQYLEKLIQYQRPLPPFTAEHVAHFLEDFISEPMNGAHENTRSRLQYAWKYYVSKVVKTPRDVLLFGNALTLQYKKIGKYSDFSDLFILEAIFYSNIKLYYFIRENFLILNKSSTEVDHEEIFSLMLANSDYKQETLEGIALSLLFPAVSEHFKIHEYTHDDKMYKLLKRLCINEHGNIYFNSAKPDAIMERRYLINIINSSEPIQSLNKFIGDVEGFGDKKSDTRIELLEILNDHFDHDNPLGTLWLIALCTVGPLFIKHKDKRIGFLTGGDNFNRLSVIIRKGLSSLDTNKALTMLHNAAIDCEDLSLICAALADKRYLNNDKNKELVYFLIEKIKKILQSDKLLEQSNPRIIIIFLLTYEGEYIVEAIDNNLIDHIHDFSTLYDMMVYTDDFNKSNITLYSWVKDFTVTKILFRSAHDIIEDKDHPNYHKAIEYISAYNQYMYNGTTHT